MSTRMGRRDFLCACGAALAAGLGTRQGARAQSRQGKPNFLIYLSDDHGLLDCSTYGASDIPTPHMEGLARDGMRFDRAFVASPACAPSRAAMLTGLMPARNGAEANHTYPRDGIRKLPACLQELGYEVAAFGKVAHGNSAKRFGFDHVDLKKSVPELRQTVTAWLEQRTGDKPLCLFVGTSNPHVGWPEKTSFKPEDMILPPTFVDTPDTRRYRARYCEEVKELDELLGDLRKLAGRHLGANTLFVYTSDHGAQWPFGKWNLYDAGIRTPFVAAWPGVIGPASTSEAMVSWIDLLPTLVELAGGTPPQDIDGRSFAAVLRGQTKTHRDRIFTTHSGDGNKNVYPIRAVRDREWKYILNLHPEYAYTTHIDFVLSPASCAYWTTWLERAKTDPRARAIVDRYHRRPAEELYYLPDDPYEQKNLASDARHAVVLERLRGELAAWMKEQGDTRKAFSAPYLLSEPDTWKAGRFLPRKAPAEKKHPRRP